MTEVTPYAIMIFLIVVVIAILTLIDNRNVHTQEVVRHYDDKNRELVRMLRDPSKLEHIHHRLRKAFDQKNGPLEKGEILMNIRESIEGQLRELVGDTFELYIIQIMEMLRLRGHLQMIGDGKYNVE
jgi:predicted Holliday junction resolvase-like endonuclease